MHPPPLLVCCEVFFFTLRMMRRVLPHAQAAAQAVTAKKVDQHHLPPHEEIDHAVAVEEAAHYLPPHEEVAHYPPPHGKEQMHFCDVIPTPEQAAVEDAEQVEPLQDDHPRRAAAPLLIVIWQSSPFPPSDVILLTKCDQYMPPPSALCCLSCPAGLSIPAQDATVHSPLHLKPLQVFGYYWTDSDGD